MATLQDAIDILDRLIEKCGGPGGTPGPCPSGQSKPSGSGRGKPKPGKPTKPTGGTYALRPPNANLASRPGRRDVKEIIKDIKKNKEPDLDTISGTIAYFARGAVKLVDKALAKADKFISKMEAGKAELKKKLKEKMDTFKEARNDAIRGMTERVKTAGKLFKRLGALAVKSTEKELRSELIKVLEEFMEEGDKLHDIADSCNAMMQGGGDEDKPEKKEEE